MNETENVLDKLTQARFQTEVIRLMWW